MAQPKHRPATYADLEALPADVVGQIAFGVLHAHPRPVPRHGHAAIELHVELGNPFRRGRDGPGGWVFLPEPELHLGEHIVVPDIAGWRSQRLPTLPTNVGIKTSPDWICEVLSPSTQRFDRTDKLAIYAAFHVEHCWYVDPAARTLEVLTRQGDKWLISDTFKNEDAVTAPPFAAHTFSLGVLWMPEADPST
jgi:Uma2 family endonuclease